MTDESGRPAYPLRMFDLAVRRVHDLSPHFRRITFSGPDLDRFGVPGPTLDLRIKLLLPAPGHVVDRPGAPGGQLVEGWYQQWLRGGQSGRGVLRSYTVRALRSTPQGPELDVDFVLHPAGGQGAPGSDWARRAIPGTAVLVIGPDSRTITRATPPKETGIRWNPRGSRNVLLAGDETAVPAISAILETLPADVSGSAFLEVPDARDVQTIRTRSSVTITWLARNHSNASQGRLLVSAIEHHCRQPSLNTIAGAAEASETYAWIGAEATTVKALRRHLVTHLGVDPKRSELRAYWSVGKAGSGSSGTPAQ